VPLGFEGLEQCLHSGSVVNGSAVVKVETGVTYGVLREKAEVFCHKEMEEP
jgi:hypothetical protein